MENIFENRNKAVSLASRKYQGGDTTYTKQSSIYIASTSNVKDTLSLYHDYESVLALGATGAHGYEAALHGAKRVDMFDINYLQKLFYEFMQTAIMYLKYEDFMKYFTLKKQSTVYKNDDLRNLLSKELYFILEPFLSEEIRAIFGDIFYFYDSPELILSSLFRFEHPIYESYLKRYISFYNEEEYYKLQKILREGSCKFNYICAPLYDIPSKLTGPYDLILLDNVLQYYKKMRGLDTPYDVNMFIRRKLSNLLSPTGCIQVAYGFTIATNAVKDLKGVNTTTANNIVTQYDIKKEQKEGICSNLLKKWDYDYNFIPGVEDSPGCENIVLTYRPKK